VAGFDMDPGPVPPSWSAPAVAVFRYDPDAEEASDRYRALPNVRAVQAAYQENASPGSARFRYEFDPAFTAPGDPRRAEDCFPPDADGPNVVLQDDRLVVRVYTEDPDADPDGPPPYLVYFDGFAQIPQADLGGQEESVTFEAYATPVRLWDQPIATSFARTGADPFQGVVVETELAPRFNPGGEGDPSGTGNKTPRVDLDGLGAEINDGEDAAYPVFVDHRIHEKSPGEARVWREKWTLGPAVRYLLNATTPGKTPAYQDYVKPPSSVGVDVLLENYQPVDGDTGLFDPSDDTTYTTDPVEVGDLDVTGETRPGAVEKVIAPHGFAFRFVLGTDEDGDPAWTIRLYRKDTAFPKKTLKLQKAGVPGAPVPDLDAGKTTLTSLSLSRDGSVVNEFRVLTAPVRYEASFCLQALFTVAAADADAANLHKWVSGDASFDPVKYRVFGYDETGDGHWDFAVGAMAFSAPTSFDRIFGKESDDPKGFKYVYRRRPATGHLFSKDALGRPRAAELHISADYAGPRPGVWDGTGTWQKVTARTWALLDDRLGIRISDKDVSDWKVGTSVAAAAPFADGVVPVPKCLATPGADNGAKLFTLRLVCVVPGDNGADALARRRAASPSTFAVRRVDELRDRFFVDYVHETSPYTEENDFGESLTTAVRDDTTDAVAHAEARRRAHELYSIGGPARVFGLTTAYSIGDRVTSVEGRGISLKQNAAAEQGEGDVYPCVVGITYEFEPEQATVLELSDRRADPVARRRR
jgi:hypothetical protein